MKLAALVHGYLAAKAGGGLFVEQDEVERLAVSAVRFYLAYGDLESLAMDACESVGLCTDVSDSEWAVIRPLFELYVEAESAHRLEASASMGVERFGRSESEIRQDIKQVEEELPVKAFLEPCFTIGID